MATAAVAESSESVRGRVRERAGGTRVDMVGLVVALVCGTGYC